MPRKTISELKICGTYRKDRHAARDREPQPGGSPEMPNGLPEEGQAFWARVVPGLVASGVATAADGPALARMAFWWSETCKLFAMHQRPTTWIYQASCADKAWRDYAARFGLTPRDRTQLRTERTAESDPAAEFIQ